MLEAKGPGFVAPATPTDAASAAATIKYLATQEGWLAKANQHGTPESTQYQDLLAAKSGMSRQEWDTVRSTGAAPKVVPTVPQPSEAPGPPLREWVNPDASPAPERIAADEAQLNDFLAQQVPTHPGAYPDLLIAGAPMPPDEQKVWKEAAHKEGYAPTEAMELATALVSASQGKDAAATARVKKMPEAEFNRMVELARAEALRLRAYPMFKEAFDRLDASKRECFGLIEVLARRGARVASRR